MQVCFFCVFFTHSLTRYNGLILRHIDYGFVIWGKSSHCFTSILQRLQYARLVLNADFLTPHTSLLRDLNRQSLFAKG